MKKINIFLLIIIAANVLIGNGIILLANSNEKPHYTLMVGMSLSCCIIFILMLNLPKFLKLTYWKQFLKLLLLNFLIVFLGTVITNIVTYSFSEVGENIGASIVMGIVGNFLMSWVSLGMGVITFIIILLLRKNILKASLRHLENHE